MIRCKEFFLSPFGNIRKLTQRSAYVTKSSTLVITNSTIAVIREKPFTFFKSNGSPISNGY